jgi:histidinol-phosphate aminotransferase
MADIRTVRPEVEAFTPYVPGLSIDEIKERYGLATVIKLASNENPLGASPIVQRAIARSAANVFRYPQAGNPRLRKAIAERLHVAPGRIVAGNGSDEIIDLLVRVKARPGVDNIVAFTPCFSLYELQARLCGVELRRPPLAADFSLPLDALLEVTDERTALVFVTNPDNPSGRVTPASALTELARALPPQALLVVDEAYVDFAEDPEAVSLVPHIEELPNVVVLRTFSKAYGLAGLRLGYGVMPEWLAELLLRVRLPFSVNLMAEEAGLAALFDEVFHRATVGMVKRGRAGVGAELERLGCEVVPSQANFLMFRPELPAGEVFEALLKRGIIIRPLKSYGLPEYCRVSIGNDQENAAFVAALAEVLQDGR